MKKILLIILLLSEITFATYSEDIFPVPKDYKNWINFWIDVFTKYSSNQLIIFDERCPEAIIAVIELKENNSSKTNIFKNFNKINKNNVLLSPILNLINENISISFIQSYSNLETIYKKCGIIKNNSIKNAPLRFQRGNKDLLKFGIIRWGLYKDTIESILKEKGLPPELSYLPLLESNYWNFAYSKIGALGLWQFMPHTGKKYLQINKYKDERLDWIKSTYAAANFLKDSFQYFGRWDISITSYNHGFQGMKQASKQLNTTDLNTIITYYKSKYFKFASKNFYLSFLAIKTIMESTNKYFPDAKLLKPLDIKIYKIPKSTPIKSLITNLKVNLITFKIFNPAFTELAYKHNIILPKNSIIYLQNNELSHQLIKLSHHSIKSNENIEQMLISLNYDENAIIALNAINEKSFKKLKKDYLIVYPPSSSPFI